VKVNVPLLVALSLLFVTLVAGVAVARDFQCGRNDLPCIGTNNDDRILERRGERQDDIRARDGEDLVNAGRYNRDRDEVYGEDGNDVLRTSDNDSRDLVDGGPGRDVCIITRGDDFENCETVRRR
jgi:signal peptidase I